MIRVQDYQSFLNPMKKSENQGLSDVFRGYRKGTLGPQWVNEGSGSNTPDY